MLGLLNYNEHTRRLPAFKWAEACQKAIQDDKLCKWRSSNTDALLDWGNEVTIVRELISIKNLAVSK